MSSENDVPGDELAAVARALAELGARPLPEAVALRLDARLAAELDSSPLALRRSRRPLRIGAGLSAAAAVAAALIFAFGSSGGHHAPPGQAVGSRSRDGGLGREGRRRSRPAEGRDGPRHDVRGAHGVPAG